MNKTIKYDYELIKVLYFRFYCYYYYYFNIALTKSNASSERLLCLTGVKLRENV